MCKHTDTLAATCTGRNDYGLLKTFRYSTKNDYQWKKGIKAGEKTDARSGGSEGEA